MFVMLKEAKKKKKILKSSKIKRQNIVKATRTKINIEGVNMMM